MQSEVQTTGCRQDAVIQPGEMSCNLGKNTNTVLFTCLVLSPNHCHDSQSARHPVKLQFREQNQVQIHGPGVLEHCHGKVNTESSPESSGSPSVASDLVTLV